mmetsp:Transcript_29603/g.76476  ORF Transcript_29603/g.76476 Transcript_29603/m.76476 type:complete len:260 (-) Transcript_29603:659-1438(-)
MHRRSVASAFSFTSMPLPLHLCMIVSVHITDVPSPYPKMPSPLSELIAHCRVIKLAPPHISIACISDPILSASTLLRALILPSCPPPPPGEVRDGEDVALATIRPAPRPPGTSFSAPPVAPTQQFSNTALAPLPTTMELHCPPPKSLPIACKLVLYPIALTHPCERDSTVQLSMKRLGAYASMVKAEKLELADAVVDDVEYAIGKGGCPVMLCNVRFFSFRLPSPTGSIKPSPPTLVAVCFGDGVAAACGSPHTMTGAP